ncbi:autotransporter outer membrane beta-barrel domain-containing protein [Stenotrophomonas sp. TWI700]|uniref:autotransporter family protein n=1 Tax=Stenotrophomonas sp. TWI700 TaxID=3136792 RepID=UPI003208E746
MVASAAETVIIRDADLDHIIPPTYAHAEIYDSKVTNYEAGGTRDWSAVSIDRGNLRLERTQVVTTGEDMAALGYYGGEYHNNGAVYDAVIEDSDFSTSGDRASGLQFSSIAFDNATGALNRVGTITVRDSNVSTTGAQSHGMTIAGVNNVGYLGGEIQTRGQGAIGVYMMGGFVRMQGSRVDTAGDAAHGIHAQSMRWGITGAPGMVYRADVGLVDASVETRGAGSVGILAGYDDRGSPEGIGSIVRLDNNTTVRSRQSHAVQFLGGRENELLLTGGSVLDGGDAILFAGVPDSVNRISAVDSTLIGRGGQAVVADNGASIHLGLDNSDVAVEAGKGLAWAANGGHIDLLAKGSRLQGSAFADATSRLDVALDGSRWDAWGQSQVDEVSLRNGSTLLIGAGSVGDQLIVRGDFAIDDSTLVFDSALGDDSSPTDYLWVQGNTSGQGDIAVNNVGGRGAQTEDGIQLIAVDGESNAGFKLQDRAVGGVYEYFLHKGSKTDPDDGGWYLRSELNDEPDPCSAEGECDPPPPPVPCSVDPGQGHCDPAVVEPPPPRPLPCSVDAGQPDCEPAVVEPPPVPVLRPEPGAYLANQTAAVQMFGQRHHDRSGTADDRGAWARITRTQAEYGVIGNQLSVDGDTNTLQVGSDVWAWGEGRGQVGVMAGHGSANNIVTSDLTGYSAKGKVTGNMVGVYASWSQQRHQEGGLYLDGSLQHARFDNSVQGDALAKETYDSRASTATAEAGYGFKVYDSGRSALFVEPQLQLSYRRFDADNLTETNGTIIDGSDADGLSSRVGVRVFGHTELDSGNRVQPFVAVNWIRESSENSLRFDGEQLAGGLPNNRYEAKAGAQLTFGERWSAWGDFGLQRGDRGYKEVAAQIGLRAGW